MYGIYGDIIGAAENALKDYEETKELLEYPEVQADKAYYLSVLSKYNKLNLLHGKLTELKDTLSEQRAVNRLLGGELSDGERTAIYEEISLLNAKALNASVCLSDALGCKRVAERAYCRLKLKRGSSAFGTALYELLKEDLRARGAKICEENVTRSKDGFVDGVSFIAEGEDVLSRFAPLSGAHKVYFAGAKSEELCFAVTPSASLESIDESDLKIDVFHSHGAGGQNINKVETAVRITHLPTGLTVTCQDERSQLKNKKRALETLEKRLKDKCAQAEKNRIEADISAQYGKKNTPISFDGAHSAFTDTRLSSFNKIPFPMTNTQFNSYLNGLMAL